MSPEQTRILETVIHWPPDSRRWLLQEVAKSLEQTTSAPGKRGRPVEELVGIGAGESPPPDDNQVREWIEEYRQRKYAR